MFNATTFASWLYHDQNLAFLSEGSFDPRSVTTGRVSVFVQPSIEALIRTPGLARVVIGILATLCMDNADPDAPRVLFDIDECARLGNMQIFELILRATVCKVRTGAAPLVSVRRPVEGDMGAAIHDEVV